MQCMTNDLVTILIPTFNGSKYIKEMLDSLERQTYTNIEVIISDDCSMDNTVPIIEMWIKQKKSNKKYTLLKNKHNRGLVRNVKSAKSYIHGQYLFLADQDDIWEENKVEVQVRYFEKHEECILNFCDRSIIWNGKTVVSSEARKNNWFDPIVENTGYVLSHPGRYGANMIAVRNVKNCCREILDIPDNIIEHDTYIVTMASLYGTVDFIRIPLVQYRIHHNNLSGNYRVETARNFIECFTYLRKSAKENYKCQHRMNDKKIIDGMLKKRWNCIEEYKTVKFSKYHFMEIYKNTMQLLYENKIGEFYCE